MYGIVTYFWCHVVGHIWRCTSQSFSHCGCLTSLWICKSDPPPRGLQLSSFFSIENNKQSVLAETKLRCISCIFTWGYRHALFGLSSFRCCFVEGTVPVGYHSFIWACDWTIIDTGLVQTCTWLGTSFTHVVGLSSLMTSHRALLTHVSPLLPDHIHRSICPPGQNPVPTPADTVPLGGVLFICGEDRVDDPGGRWAVSVRDHWPFLYSNCRHDDMRR